MFFIFQNNSTQSQIADVTEVTLNHPSVFIPAIGALLLLIFIYLVFDKITSKTKAAGLTITIAIFGLLVLSGSRPFSKILFFFDGKSFNVELDNVATEVSQELRQGFDSTSNDNARLISQLQSDLSAMVKLLDSLGETKNIESKIEEVKQVDFRKKIEVKLPQSVLPTQPDTEQQIPPSEPKKAKTLKISLKTLTALELQQNKGDQLYYNLRLVNTETGEERVLDNSDSNDPILFGPTKTPRNIPLTVTLDIDKVATGKQILKMELVIKWRRKWFLFKTHTFTLEQLSQMGMGHFIADYKSKWHPKKYRVDYSISLEP